MSLVISIVSLCILLSAYSYLGLANIIPAEYVVYVDKWVIIFGGFLGIWIASGVVDKILTHFFARAVKGNGLARKIFPLLRYIAKIFVWLVGIFFILTLLKINVSALIAGAGISGIAIAFAGKDYAANLIGSVNLIFSRSFQIGDTIRVKGYEGKVEEITLTITRLIDKNGATIFMPNKLIVSESIENLTDKQFERIKICVEVPLDQKTQTPEGVIDSIEKEVERLGKKYSITESHVGIEKIVATGVIINARVVAEIGTDMEAIKKSLYAAARKTKM